MINISEIEKRIGKEVKIVPLENIKGRVLGIYLSEGLPKYDVRYYLNGEAKSCYFLYSELEFI